MGMLNTLFNILDEIIESELIQLNHVHLESLKIPYIWSVFRLESWTLVWVLYFGTAQFNIVCFITFSTLTWLK